METFEEHRLSWQRDSFDIPVLRNTNDALLFAQLIYDNESEYNLIKHTLALQDALLQTAKETSSFSLQTLLNMACKAQLYRECSVEIQRLRDAKYHL